MEVFYYGTITGMKRAKCEFAHCLLEPCDVDIARGDCIQTNARIANLTHQTPTIA